MNEVRKSSSKIHDPAKTAHILITQCLQNGFFLADDCKLCLPKEPVVQMLVGNQLDVDSSESGTSDLKHIFLPGSRHDNRRTIRRKYLKNGPLYRFLENAIKKNPRYSDLHVIHLRDWHTLSEQYDHERRIYGKHCEANTWEAESLDGFEEFLAPWKNDARKKEKAQSLEGYKNGKDSKVHFYEVLSDSVFDFRRSDTIEYSLRDNDPRSYFERVFQQITDGMEQVYVVVIGVFTDIKIKTLLMGLQSRFPIQNLIVCDVLTAAPTMERHLEGLDFADKVLDVEVIHSLNSALSVLDHEEGSNGKGFKEIPQELYSLCVDYTKMRTFFLNRQNVLGYQDQKIAEYLLLTSRRSSDVYRHVYTTNRWLTSFGRVSLSLLLVLIVAEVFFEQTIDWKAWLAAGLGSTAQILPAFFTKPLERMQQNLNNLVRLRNYLESYSLTTAVLRHHLTSTELLDNHDVESLRKQFALIQDIASSMRDTFSDIAGVTEETPCNAAEQPKKDHLGRTEDDRAPTEVVQSS